MGQILPSLRRSAADSSGAASDDFDHALSSMTADLVTFGDQQALCRGIALALVLRSAGAIFQGSAGSAGTYMMSRTTERIKAFLSHNWIVPRWKKFVALSFHFNTDVACCGSALCTLPLALLTAAGSLPFVDAGINRGSGFFIRLLFVPIFLILLFFARDLGRVFGFYGPLVFLDKACINQVDTSAQRAAILKLGAFLAKSDQVIVLYTNEYLKKLWTVYEVASFLVLHPVDRMKVVPVTHAIVFVFGTLIFYIFNIGIVFVTTWKLGVLVYPIAFVCGWGAMYVLRTWARDRILIQSRLSEFDVHDCICFLEADRPVVYGNIATLMKASRAVHRHASEDEALGAFNDLVHSILPNAFDRALGQRHFQLKHYLLFGLCANGAATLDYTCSDIARDEVPRKVLGTFLYNSLLAASLWPLVLMLMEVVTSRFLHLQGWRERVYMFSVFLLGIVTPFVLVRGCASALAEEVVDSNWALAAMLLIHAVFFTLTAVVGSGRRGCCMRAPQTVVGDRGSGLSLGGPEGSSSVEAEEVDIHVAEGLAECVETFHGSSSDKVADGAVHGANTTDEWN